jgi:predicted Fe-Mo cluster-binding NifX family protein
MGRRTVSSSTVVAVPVWGSRILPRFGEAREFRFAEIERPGGTIRWLGTRGWDPEKNAGLASWLRTSGAGGVICGGIHPRFLLALEAESLWVCWGQRGEVEEVLRRWARGESHCPRDRAAGPDAVQGAVLDREETEHENRRDGRRS